MNNPSHEKPAPTSAPLLVGTDAWHAETVARLLARLSHVDHDLEGDYELAGRVVRYVELFESVAATFDPEGASWADSA